MVRLLRVWARWFWGWLGKGGEGEERLDVGEWWLKRELKAGGGEGDVGGVSGVLFIFYFLFFGIRGVMRGDVFEMKGDRC